jgi:hypothetical protein
VVELELRRSDIGFGRLVVDDTGVTRRFALSATSIAWDEVRDYHLKIEIRGARLEVLYLVRWVDVLLIANDARRGYRGEHRLRFGMVLLGEHKRVAFNWRFRGVEVAIAQILQRIHPQLTLPVQTGFARHGITQFGPLTIGEHAIRWGDQPALARAAVETVELFNSSPVRLRVMARRKVWPYGQAELADIPNVAAALELAEHLDLRLVRASPAGPSRRRSAGLVGHRDRRTRTVPRSPGRARHRRVATWQLDVTVRLSGVQACPA